MSEKKDKKEVTVVAEYTISSSAGTQVVRTHCAAWTTVRKQPLPASATFLRWARKDKKKEADHA